MSTPRSGSVGEPAGLVMDVYGHLRQGGCMLPVVVRAEQQFQETGEQDPNISLSATAITAIHGREPRDGRLSSGRGVLFILFALGPAPSPELAGAHDLYLPRSGGERLASSPSHALVNGKAMASVVALPSAIARP